MIAPFLPGFGDPDATGLDPGEYRDMLDFTLFGLETFNASKLRKPTLMGHSMGGMIAAEMAALAPEKFERLALINALGLWLDDHPVADLFAALPHELPDLLFHDGQVAFMARLGVIGGGLEQGVNDPDLLVAHLVRQASQMGAAGKLLFPIPDRGLRQRLYRIQAKTDVIWGEADRLAPSAYGRAFAGGIAGARLTLVPQAGHMAHWEQPQAVVRALAGELR